MYSLRLVGGMLSSEGLRYLRIPDEAKIYCWGRSHPIASHDPRHRWAHTNLLSKMTLRKSDPRVLTQASGHTHRVAPEDTSAQELQASITFLPRQV